MSFKTFYNMLTEGGNALDGTTSIPQERIPKTLDNLIKDVLNPLGIKVKGKDWELLGSAMKKKAHSGDLDIAINTEGTEGLKEKIEAFMKKKGYDSVYIPMSKTLSIKFPIADTKEFVQVDLMFTNDIGYTSFSRHSPHEKDSTSVKTKFGTYRNLLMASIAAEIAYEKKGNVVTKYALNVEDGLFKNTLDYTGKKPGTLLAKPKTVSRDFITKSPEKIVKILLGDGATVKDADSFESIWKFMNSPKFKYKNKIKDIKEKFKVALENNNLEIPSEIK